MPNNTNEDWSRKPFKEALAFFKQKMALPTKTWSDIRRADHDRAFVVAGLTRMSALEEIATVIERQMRTGILFEDFKKQFSAIVDRAGWAHTGSRAWRARVILETNVATSYAAGRWAQLQDPDAIKALPYIQYRHSGAEHYRPQHKAWDKLVLLRTDKFWDTNLPPNGWGCKCEFFPLSKRSLTRLGKTGPDRNPYDVMAEKGQAITTKKVWRDTGEVVDVPAGVDLGWDYAPGKSLLRSITAVEKSAITNARIIPLVEWPASDRPLPRPFNAANILPETLDEKELLARFLKAFGGIDEPIYFDDKIGNLLAINEFMFTDRKGNTKIKKRGRDPYLLALAEAIQDPDEIFSLLEYREAEQVWHNKLRYIAQFIVPGHLQPLIAIFDYGRDGWVGKTAFVEAADQVGYVASQRQGVRLYRRK